MFRMTMTMTMTVLASAAMLGVMAFAAQTAEPVDRAPEDAAQGLSFTMLRLSGEPENLEDYRGKVVLMVNTASKCGFTPQYAGLQALYEKYKDQGLVVLGFPANNFGGQEPGTSHDIAEFCRENYGVTFPIFAKISVKGEDIHPLYRKLIGAPAPIGGEVQWNFQKYLLDRDGHVVSKFLSPVEPQDEQITKQIEELLAQQAKS